MAAKKKKPTKPAKNATKKGARAPSGTGSRKSDRKAGASKKAPPKKPTKTPPPKGARPIREGAFAAKVFNSGLEVWLYDEANIPKLRESGAMADLTDGSDAKLRAFIAEGLVVGYGLYQDDSLDVEVVVGPPLTEAELSRSAWLEPQTAFLRLPSGRLRVDSNDTTLIGAEEGGGDQGASISVPPGDYKVTLYRVDHEALDREERTWEGPQEVVVLTPGGTPASAAKEILPFEQRRDLSWVGKYEIQGKTFTGLAWFPDYWDTYRVNLDRAAAERLGLAPGHVVRTTVPEAGISLVTTFATSWIEGGKLAPPEGIPLDEYGYGYVAAMADWGGKEALFCRRARTRTGIKDPQKNVWLPATVEVLDVRAKPPARVRGELVHDAGKRVFWKGDLRSRTYFPDLQFLTARLMGRVDGLEWGKDTPLAHAVDLVDQALGPLGLEPLGDFGFDVAEMLGNTREYTNRLYAGLPDTFAIIWGAAATFEVWFVSEIEGGTWALTGIVTDRFAEAMSKRKNLSVRAGSGRLANVLEAHRSHLAALGRPALPAPRTFEEAVRRYEGYLKVALD